MGRPFLPRPICRVCGAVCKSRGRAFCSYKCRAESERGVPRPYARGNKWSWKGDRAGVWAHYKRMQALVPRGPCEVCGSMKQSVIHHKDHDPKNTTRENLMRMCRACHARHHRPTRNDHGPHPL